MLATGSIYIPLWVVLVGLSAICWIPAAIDFYKKSRDWLIGRFYDFKYRSYKGS